MQDLLTWGAIIAASGSVVTVVKFWMDMGTRPPPRRKRR
jgi:hypothetical protein